jgi:hypothetical protein
MRQSHERLLLAKGIRLGKTLPLKGLRVFVAKDFQGNSLLIFRGNPLGPTWPSLASYLEQSDIEHSLIEAGKTWLVTIDSIATREVLQASNASALKSAREEILVPEVGFVEAGIKRRFDLRVLIGPAALALASLGLMFVPAAMPESTDQEEIQAREETCALDLDSAEIVQWITSSIEESSLSSGEVLVQSKLGDLNLEIEQTLGSAQSVTGSIRCDDGRSKTLHYRLDSSANGELVELSQKLDP